MKKSFIFFLAVCVLLVSIMFYYNIKVYFRMVQNNDKVKFAEQILSETQEAKVIMESNIMTKDSQMDNVRVEIETERNKSLELSKKLAEKVNETLVIKDELRKTRKEFKKTLKRMDKEKEKQKTIVEEAEKYKKQVVGLKERLDKLKKDVPQEGQVISMPREQTIKEKILKSPPPQKEQGKILKINKDYNFVVIDLGVVDAIDKGNIVKVMRDGVVVSKIRIEKVYEKMASAVVVRGPLKIDGLVSGDMVRK